LLQQAQAHLEEEKWQEAAVILDDISSTGSVTPEILYDKGIAHYNVDEFEIAAKAFEDAMETTNDQTLRTYSAFNFGNSIFQKTMQDLEGTGTATSSDEAINAMEKAKDQINHALKNYRRTILEDASDMDARANGELAWKMLKQLDQMQDQMEEQQKQQEQQKQENQEQQQDEESADEQEKDQQNKEQGDQSEQQKQDGEQEQDQQEQQQQQGDQSEQQKQDGEQSKDQQQQQQQKQSDQSEQQKQDGEQSKDQQQQQQQKQSDQSEQQKQDGEQSKDQQQQKQQQQQQQNDESEKQEQEENIEGELKSIQESGNEEEAQAGNVKEEGKRLSKDEAARLLQLIRDKEQQRRKALSAKRASRRTPVEKDW
jgi:hypothetical protein